MRYARIVALVVLAAAVAASGIDRPGPAVRQAVKGTRSDAERAVKLLAAGKAAEGETAGDLLKWAVYYALRAPREAEAVDAGREATDLLIDRQPARADHWQGKRLDVERAAWRYAARDEREQAARGFLEFLLNRADALEADRQWAAAQDVYREAYSVAYAIRSPLVEQVAYKRARAGHYAEVAEQVRAAVEGLARQDDPAVREEALRQLVAELDNVPRARTLVTADVDQSWQAYLPLAEKDPDTLDEAAAKELGIWYHAFLLPKASKFSQMRILAAARACLRRADILHEADDAEGKAIRQKLAEVHRQFEELVMHPAASDRAADVDLLRSIDLETTRWEGVWDFVKGTLTVWPRGGHAYFRLPARVTGSYRLSLQFANYHRIPLPDRFSKFGTLRVSRRRKKWLDRKIAEQRGLDVAFPVGKEHLAVSIVPTEDASTVSLLLVPPSSVRQATSFPTEEPLPEPIKDPKGRSDVFTVAAPALPTQRFHRLDVAVFVQGDHATVAVNLNDEPLIRWEGKASLVGLDDHWPMGDLRGAILLGGWTGPTCFNAAKVVNFTGRTRLDPPDLWENTEGEEL